MAYKNTDVQILSERNYISLNVIKARGENCSLK